MKDRRRFPAIGTLLVFLTAFPGIFPSAMILKKSGLQK
jgi:hypothetical protein